ncbi:hypothetical protein EYC84_005417 [Monilinia fructicola]|uniref:Uncharacterized protein n=1 Tax=Monilinia fructicola TaxID=38448 RepID=A0A5M9JWE1_MONFR|nr:hypothetical protein EYC84_005417 [Monilinia fructicola]
MRDDLSYSSRQAISSFAQGSYSICCQWRRILISLLSIPWRDLERLLQRPIEMEDLVTPAEHYAESALQRGKWRHCRPGLGSINIKSTAF